MRCRRACRGVREVGRPNLRRGALDRLDVRVPRWPAEEGEAVLQLLVTLPEDLSSGEWYLVLVADPDEENGELDRNDNRLVSAIPLRVQNARDTGPDLAVRVIWLARLALGALSLALPALHAYFEHELVASQTLRWRGRG